MNPEVWDRELQICCDILRSDGNVGTLVKEQKVPIYMSCPDFEYVTEYNVPRFGAGVFSLVLRHVFKKLTGRKLELTNFGKPYRSTYDLAEQHLQEMAKDMGYEDGITKIYGEADDGNQDNKKLDNIPQDMQENSQDSINNSSCNNGGSMSLDISLICFLLATYFVKKYKFYT